MIRVWLGWLVRGLVGLVALAAVVYLGDAAVLEYRVKHGTGYGTVQVHTLLATKLKGNKVEYDSIGYGPQRCSRSIFPQDGVQACWWLERNPTQWE